MKVIRLTVCVALVALAIPASASAQALTDPLAGGGGPTPQHIAVCEIPPSFAAIAKNGNAIAAYGIVYCDSRVDQISIKGCTDIWATGGYWSELSCTGYRTCYNSGSCRSLEDIRTCTSGRTYRARAPWNVTHVGTTYGVLYGSAVGC